MEAVQHWAENTPTSFFCEEQPSMDQANPTVRQESTRPIGLPTGSHRQTIGVGTGETSKKALSGRASFFRVVEGAKCARRIV